MGDLESGNGKEQAREDGDDMITAAGRDISALLKLADCYRELISLALPFTDNHGKIQAPNGRIPIEKISQRTRTAVEKLDGAFLETMAMTEFMATLEEGLRAVERKITKSAAESERTRDYR